MRVVLGLVLVKPKLMGALPSYAATATGTRVVSAVVTNRCALSSDPADGTTAVKCNGITPPFRIVESGKSVTVSDNKFLRTVFF